MNQDKFDEQLKKYKVVRSADYYKERSHRPKVNQASSSMGKPGSTTSKGKKNTAETSPPAAGVFGEIERKCAEDLTRDELATFMSNLKSYQMSVAKRVNLNDLEALCT